MNPTVSIQTAPHYWEDHTLFCVESQQTTKDLESHYVPHEHREPIPKAAPRTKSKNISKV